MTLILSEYIKDYQVTLNEYQHKSGLKIIKIVPAEIQGKQIENTFMIQFKTPSVKPIENSGVQHIIEHSVLCGSFNFDLKEPFANLLQSQITSYLNAGTYTEHTEYPASSRNLKSYQTLMEVYLDAVFNPELLNDQLIFAQEGHHKVVNDQNQVIESGVVLNEMRGALSDIIQIGFDQCKKQLFDNSPMGTNSGGDPEDIQNLTYEQLIQYYKQHYTPQNGYIVLYSLLPIEEEIKIIEKHLPNRQGQHIKIEKKQQVTNQLKTIKQNGINEQDVFFAGFHNYDQDTVTIEEYILQLILDELIHDSPNSYFKTEFEGDFSSSYDNTEIQAYNIISLSGSNVQSVEEFQQRMQKIYQKLASDEDNYINYEALHALLLKYQNKYREQKSDFGIYLGHQIMKDYLYDSQTVFKYLDQQDIITQLLNDKDIVQKVKQILKDTYFVGSYVHLIQSPEIEKQEEQQKQYSQEEIQQIKQYDQQVKQRQERQDKEEEIQKLSTLTYEDLENMHEDIKQLKLQEFVYNKQLITTFKSDEKGISNVILVYDVTDQITIEQAQILTTYTQLLEQVRTQHLKLNELEQQMQQTFIKFSISVETLENENNNCTKLYVQIVERFINENAEKAKQLTDEILYHSMSALTEDILQKELIRMINELHDSLQGESAYEIAQIRSQAQYHGSSTAIEMLSGVSYLRYLEKKSITVQQLQDIVQLIQQAPMLLSICTQEKQMEEKLIQIYSEQRNQIFNIQANYSNYFKPQQFKSVIIPGEVNYVAQSLYYNNISQRPSNLLINTILQNKYLWDKVRVHGGAYGCFISTSMDNLLTIVSYRDPNIANTIEVYKSISQYIENSNYTEKELFQFKIGALSRRQKSLLIKKRFELAIKYYLLNIDVDQYAQNIHDMLNVQNDDIKQLAPIYKELAQQPIIVCGNQEKMEEDKIQNVEKI